MSPFLPLLDQGDADLSTALLRIGPIIVPGLNALSESISLPSRCYLLFDHDTSVDFDQLVSYLDGGVEKIIIPLSWANELIGVLPADRLYLLLDSSNVAAVSDKVRSGISGVMLKSRTVDVDLVASVSSFFKDCSMLLYPSTTSPPSPNTIRQVQSSGASVVIPTSQLTLSLSSSGKLNVGDAYISTLVSDRPDGLYPTVVCSETGHSLGLVYSSKESITESICTGKGVYQSRKHGLWRKGETSGATQTVVSIRSDCDSDSLEFTVIQSGTGFCHLNRSSCFGNTGGLPALEKTLQSRLKSAPEGSYTKRLFGDRDLLRSKIMEEADELCRAEKPEEVAFEAADLIYFALVKCTALGVSIFDIEKSLDKKAKKITRRSGDAKPQWSSKPKTAPAPAPAAMVDADAPIKMRTYDLSSIAGSERSQLLRRPVLKSDEMINKVRPIVEDVRKRGDAALLELTAKFDKAKLEKTVVFPPYAEETMKLGDSVREAINVAYKNIKVFHEAQAQGSTLHVWGFMSRGGTAVLPSTALMLGIPAQVAGCKEIVLATPPRPDGSISPEVMYVAKLVGASAVLKAGGAQAVAAMAYGTETVPKVDKIFGPGNQWVTAAKMLVQNDTDALVSIDMPAGPSEVLVIADHTANPGFVAADLLSQAEHGIDSQVVLVSVALDEAQLAAIEKEVDAQARALSRVSILRQSVAKSIIVKASTVQEAIQFSNDYAPEHLIMHLEGASQYVKDVENAGSVFVGPYSPESCGDYASGTNHTLPTNGYARQFSGVNTLSFQKHITSQEVSREGLKDLGPVVATLADCEGLDAHANAVRIRMKAIQAESA